MIQFRRLLLLSFTEVLNNALLWCLVKSEPWQLPWAEDLVPCSSITRIRRKEKEDRGGRGGGGVN